MGDSGGVEVLIDMNESKSYMSSVSENCLDCRP